MARKVTRYCQDYEDTSPCTDMACPSPHWYRAADYDALRRMAGRLSEALKYGIFIEECDLLPSESVKVFLRSATEAIADYEAGGFGKIN